MQVVGDLTEGDAHVGKVALADILAGAEHDGLAALRAGRRADAAGTVSPQHPTAAPQPLDIRLVEEVVVVLAAAVEETVIVVRLQFVVPADTPEDACSR